MFCRNCGTEISDVAKFCPKCGNRINREQEPSKKIIEDNNIRFALKPEFNLPYKMLNAIWTGLLWVILIVVEFGEYGISTEFIMFLIAFFIIYIILNLVFGKKQYDKLEYNFYSTKVEYIDGFFNKEQKELKYKYIREVTMSQNILERFCGIGKIKIFTNASSGYGTYNNHNSGGRNGVYIHCVVDVEEQYKAIKQIINEGTLED